MKCNLTAATLLLFSSAILTASHVPNCDDVSTLKIILKIELDPNAPIEQKFDGTNLERAKQTSQAHKHLVLLDSRGNPRDAWLFLQRQSDPIWRLYLLVRGSDLDNYSPQEPPDGLIILEQAFLETSPKTGGLHRFVPQHFPAEDFDNLKAGEQSAHQKFVREDQESSIRWTNAVPLDHLEIQVGQNGSMRSYDYPRQLVGPQGSLRVGRKSVISILSLNSGYDRYCPKEYLHDMKSRYRRSE